MDQIAKWSDPIPCPCGQCSAKTVKLMQNGVSLGQVAWDENEIFAARTQVETIGAFVSLEVAKDVIENVAAYQLYAYRTQGSA